jgi:hypothetical protein
MCYKDKTFCIAECKPKEPCPHQLTKQVELDAKRWWGSDKAPIMIADLSKDCEAHVALK